MKKFLVAMNSISGEYEADSREQALEAFAGDAGYKNWADAVAQGLASDDQVIVTEVLDKTATDTRIIIAETKSGSGFVKNAFRCNDEADFVARIANLAERSDEDIHTVHDAVAYLNEKYSQRTEIITKADFDKMTTGSWDTAVLKEAEKLGWYEAPSEGEDE